MQVKICETFISIQGESSQAGRPCFFIRLAGCNLHCTYCDTAYAARTAGRPRSVSSLLQAFQKTKLNLVAVTGGEPLIQLGVIALLERLQKHGTVLVETNGSQDISRLPSEVIAILDIKCPSSGESQAMDWKNLRRLRRQDEIKFVISDRHDYLWARRLIKAQRLVQRCAMVLMSPTSGVPGQPLPPATLADWILKDRLPVRLNLQLHRYLWPAATRGV